MQRRCNSERESKATQGEQKQTAKKRQWNKIATGTDLKAKHVQLTGLDWIR